MLINQVWVLKFEAQYAYQKVRYRNYYNNLLLFIGKRYKSISEIILPI